jgi:serpin B
MDANILDDYLAAIVAYYDAQCYTAPLDTKEAMNSMNEWVKEHTEGMIPTVFDNPLTEDTMLVLINTVYMKAQWLTEFKKEGTSKDTFHKLDGDTKVNFMHRTAGYGYAAGEGYESVKLSYKSDNLAFIAIKPTDGTARELLSSLTSESLNEIINSMESQKVRLSIPKFTIDYSMELNDPLSDMGLSSLFDAGTADLSLMGTGEDGMPLYVSRIFQKVKIIVDEKGTEAAAATVSETNTTAAAPTEEPIEMKLDEPFIYAIIETEYNTPVFIGIMDDPA